MAEAAFGVKTSPPDIAPDIVPPHNIELEQALLGAILVMNDVYSKIAEITAPVHFYEPLHGEIYRVIQSALRDQRIADPISLAPYLANWPDINETMTVKKYLGRLAVNATTIINAPAYAREVRDLWQRRELIYAAQQAIASARVIDSDLSADTIIDGFEADMVAVMRSEESGREIMFRDALEQVLLQTSDAMGRDGALAGLATGLTDVDDMMGGLADSDLIVIAGRPSMGKTALAMGFGLSAAIDGAFVHFFSQEMSASQLAGRALAMETGLSTDAMRRGKLSQDDYRVLHKTASSDRFSRLPIHIDETGGMTVHQLAAKARRVKRKHGTKLIIIDYLQLLRGTSKQGNRVQDVTEITIGLKSLAKELGIPVVALSQLSRQVEQRQDKRPQLSDLRESGSIEQDADIVVFVYREEYYHARAEPDDGDMAAWSEWEKKKRDIAGLAEVIIGKQRHGPTGTVRLHYNAPRTQFYCLQKGGQNG